MIYLFEKLQKRDTGARSQELTGIESCVKVFDYIYLLRFIGKRHTLKPGGEEPLHLCVRDLSPCFDSYALLLVSTEDSELGKP